MRVLYGVPVPAGWAPPYAIVLPQSVGQAIANELNPRLSKPKSLQHQLESLYLPRLQN